MQITPLPHVCAHKHTHTHTHTHTHLKHKLSIICFHLSFYTSCPSFDCFFRSVFLLLISLFSNLFDGLLCRVFVRFTLSISFWRLRNLFVPIIFVSRSCAEFSDDVCVFHNKTDPLENMILDLTNLSEFPLASTQVPQEVIIVKIIDFVVLLHITPAVD